MRRIVLLVAAVLLAFGACLRGSFHFDDYNLLASPAIYRPSGFGFAGKLQTRPLTDFTIWLNYRLSGADPFSYHAVNLALHLAAVLLLYFALYRLVHRDAAFWAALIFAVHPAQSEAVAYIFARGTLLSALFCLLSLSFWLRQRWTLALAAFVCALLSKEECVTFPIVLLLLSPKKVRYWPIVSMMAAAGLIGAHSLWATAQVAASGAGFTAGIAPMQYLFTQGLSILRYLQLLILPLGFTVQPSIPVNHPLLLVVAWALVIAVAAVLWKLRLRHLWTPWALAGLLLLLPSSSFFPAADLAADRRMYLPMIGFATACGLLFRRLALPVSVLATAALIVLSFVRMEVWRTEENLWKEAAQRSPKSVRPLLQLSRVAPGPLALPYLAQAKKLEPTNPVVSTELGRYWISAGRFDLALPEFGRALALDPRSPNALANRGAALLGLRQTNAARQDFRRALALDPCVLAARTNLQTLGERNLPPCPATAR